MVLDIRYINTGTGPNSGNGDTLRTAFNKINYNFEQLSTASFGGGGTGTVFNQNLNTYDSPGFQNLSVLGNSYLDRIISTGTSDFFSIRVSSTATIGTANITTASIVGATVTNLTAVNATLENLTVNSTATVSFANFYVGSNSYMNNITSTGTSNLRTLVVGTTATIPRAVISTATIGTASITNLTGNNSTFTNLTVTSTATIRDIVNINQFTDFSTIQNLNATDAVLAQFTSTIGAVNNLTVGTITYTQTPVIPNVRVTSTATIANITSTGTSILRNLQVYNIATFTNIVPNLDDTYYVGSVTKRWKGIYVSDIFNLNGQLVSATTSGQLLVNGNPITTRIATTTQTGYVQVGHNLSISAAGTLTSYNSTIYDNPPNEAIEGDQWFDSVGGKQYVYYQGVWVETNITGVGEPGSIGPSGPPGPQGLTGQQGVSVTLQGSTSTVGGLPLTGNAGDGWIVTADGHLYFWSVINSQWEDIGEIVGPQGDVGDTGPMGPSGAQGPSGPRGYQGAIGPSGPQGAVGPTGPNSLPADAQGFLYNDGEGNVSWDLSGINISIDRLIAANAELILNPDYTITLPDGSTFVNGFLQAQAASSVGLQDSNGHNRIYTQDQSINIDATTDGVNINTWIFAEDGSLTVPGDVVPYDDDQVNLGVDGLRFKDVNLSGTASANRLSLTNGDDANGTLGINQIAFGYGGTTDWAHYIRTRHNDSNYTGNAIEFYTNANQTGGPNDPVLGLIIENGNLTLGNDIFARESNDLNVTVYNNTSTGGATFSVRNCGSDLGNDRTTQFDVAQNEIILTTDYSGAGNIWTFDNTGTLHLPSTIGDIKRDGVSVLGGGGGSGPTDRLTTGSYSVVLGSDGVVTLPGDIIPDADLSYDLGSTSSQWRSIYVGTGTIYIGGVALGVNQDNYVTVDGNPIITVNTSGNLTVQGDTNIVLGSVAIGDTAPDATTPGSQWYNTVEGRTYIAVDGLWIDANPTEIPAPGTYLDDLAIDGATISRADTAGNSRITLATDRVTIQSSSGAPSWWSIYGDLDRNFSYEYGAGSVYDASGNLYVVGTFQTMGPENLLLLKYSSTGELVWAKSYGGDPGDSQIHGESILFDTNSGHLYILTTQEDSWYGVIEMTTDGDIVRGIHGDVDQEVNAIDFTIDGDGNIYLLADTSDDPGTAAPNNIIVRLDAATLDVVWAQNVTMGYSVEEPNQGQGFGAIEYSNGYIYVTGGVNPDGPNFAFVAKFDALTGDQQWLNDAVIVDGSPGPSTGAVGMGLCLDPSDNVYVTLTADEENGASIIVKYDSSGVFQWSRTLMWYQGGGDVDINYHDGYVYPTGVIYAQQSRGPSTPQGDQGPGWIHWAKIDAITGDVIYQRAFGKSIEDSRTDVWKFKGHDLGSIYNDRLSISAFVYESLTTSTADANMLTLQLPLSEVTTGTYGQYQVLDFDPSQAAPWSGPYFTTTNWLSVGTGLTATVYTNLAGNETFNWTTSTVTVDEPMSYVTGSISSSGGSGISTWDFSGGNITLPPGGDILDSTGASVLGTVGTTALGDRLTSGTASLIYTSDGSLLTTSSLYVSSFGTSTYGAFGWADAFGNPTKAAGIIANNTFSTSTGDLLVYAGDVYGPLTNQIWIFGNDGVLTLSTASTILGNSTDPNVYIETSTTGTTSTWTFGSDGATTLPGLMTLPVTNSIPAITTATGTVAVCDGTGWNGGGDGLQHLMIYINGTWTKVV